MSDRADPVIIPGLVSVVTASYNMGGYIAETLDSVLAQAYPHIESIVVDDGSTDDTSRVLERYAGDPRVRVVCQANAGQTVAKNRGLREARGEFIAFCDADDTWRSDKLSRQLPRLADPRVAVVYSDIECVDGQGKVLPYYDVPHYEGRVTAQLLIDNFVPFPTALARAAVLRAAGGFDESLTMSIDYDLWLRISVDHHFAFVPERLANYRVWDGQMSKKTGERLDNFMRLLDRFLKDHPGAATRREIDRAYAHVYVTRGYWHAREGRRADAWRDYREALRRDPLALRMWKRIVSLGLDRDRLRARGDDMRLPDALVGGLFEPAWDVYERSARLRELRRLRRTQWDAPEVVRARQESALRTMVAHAAGTCAFYREGFAQAGIDPADVRTLEDLTRLPLVTKDDIRGRRDDFVSSRHRRQDLRKAKTGGSTGVSLEVYCDEPGVQLRTGAALRADEWSGWKLGQPMAAVWGNPPVPATWKARLRATLKERIIYLDTMRIDRPALERFLADWDRLRPGMLFGHAHSLFILAEFLRDEGRRLNPSGVVATSMMLLENERRVIEEVCGVPVTNRYGCEEVSLIACECERHHGLHLNADHVITEFLREDGSPCAPGEDGRLVVTELINFGMPLIRYELGDRGVPSDRRCPCGRGLPLMEQVTGRTADFLRAEGGFRVQGISIIENTLTKLPGIRQMQIVQEEPLRLQVHLVPGPGWGDDVAAELLATLRAILGQGMAIDLFPAAQIPQEKNGKYRFTICRLQGNI